MRQKRKAAAEESSRLKPERRMKLALTKREAEQTKREGSGESWESMREEQTFLGSWVEQRIGCRR